MAGEWETVKETDDGWETVPSLSETVKAAGTKLIPRKSPEEIQAQAGEDAVRDMVKQMSWHEAMRVGSGREIDKVLTGTADIGDKILEKWGVGGDKTTKRRSDRAKEESENDREYRILREEHGIAAGAGGILPYLATLPLGLAGGTTRGAPTAVNLAKKPAMDFLKMLGIDMAAGGTQGALHYDDTALEGALWGGVGAVGGKLVGDLLGGKVNSLIGDENKIVEFAKKHGLFVPPGMATGNKSLQQMDQALKTHRNTAGKVSARMDQNNIIQNNMISKELGGETTDYFTDDYIESEMKRIGKTFDNLSKDSTGVVTDNDAFKVTDIIDGYMESAIDPSVPRVMKNAEGKLMDIFDKGGELTGDTYQNTASKIRARAVNQFKQGDAPMGHALNSIAKVYDDIIERSGTVDKGAWSKARKEFALLNSIDETKDIAGNAIPRVLGRKFKSSQTINDLAKVDALRNKQPGSSLSTSSLLGNILKTGDVGAATGGLSLLSGRTLGGVLPLVEDVTTSLYLSGYPHASGLLGNWAGGTSEKLIPRLLMSDQDEE